MSERSFEPDPLDELREILGAAEKLAADEEAFVEAFDAFAVSDAARFQTLSSERGSVTGASSCASTSARSAASARVSASAPNGPRVPSTPKKS